MPKTALERRDQAVRTLARRLDDSGVPYAIAGAMAMAAHGFRRPTSDVDVLMTHAGLAEFKRRFLGHGYAERFTGSHRLRDTELEVSIAISITGEFPGDGRHKAVAFPDPATVAVRASAGAVAMLPLASLIELKLAAGMTAPARTLDLADVVALCRAGKLGRDYGAAFNPWVKARFDELWLTAQVAA
ncbi:MAG: hypothetical protein IT370_28900 [Deltaproteobacteria bacterium]|nr:hypothetical protein [Deltaproteobacteria bacterium]